MYEIQIFLYSGYGGSELGKRLLKGKANFTLIDQRSFMHDNVLAVRAAVVPGMLNCMNM